jgi:hypothetical protein
MARNQQRFNDSGRFSNDHSGSYRYHEPDRYYRAERDRNQYGIAHSDGDRDDGHFSDRDWDRQNRGGPYWSDDDYGEQRARWMKGPSERTFKNAGDWNAGQPSRARSYEDYVDGRRLGPRTNYRDDQGYGPTTGGEFGPGSMDNGRYAYGNRNQDDRDRGDYDAGGYRGDHIRTETRSMVRYGDDDYRYSPSTRYADDEHGRFSGNGARDAGYPPRGSGGAWGRSNSDDHYRNSDEARYSRGRGNDGRDYRDTPDRNGGSDRYRDVF